MKRDDNRQIKLGGSIASPSGDEWYTFGFVMEGGFRRYLATYHSTDYPDGFITDTARFIVNLVHRIERRHPTWTYTAISAIN